MLKALQAHRMFSSFSFNMMNALTSNVCVSSACWQLTCEVSIDVIRHNGKDSVLMSFFMVSATNIFGAIVVMTRVSAIGRSLDVGFGGIRYGGGVFRGNGGGPTRGGG